MLYVKQFWGVLQVVFLLVGLVGLFLHKFLTRPLRNPLLPNRQVGLLLLIVLVRGFILRQLLHLSHPVAKK
jgi:hypothetical protein